MQPMSTFASIVRVSQTPDHQGELGPVHEKQQQIAQARREAVLVAAMWISLRDGITKDEATRSLVGMLPWDQLAAM